MDIPHQCDSRMTLAVLRSSIRGIACALCLGLFFPITAQAQVLNQRVNQLLSNNCSELLRGDSSNVLGTNLQAACTSAPGVTGSGNSNGGGAATIQTAAISILNRNLMSRLDDIRNESTATAAQPSQMMAMNPFGLLSPGMIRGFGALAPVNPSGDSSSAGFATGSHGRMKGLGLFASGLVEALNRDVTTFQDGYKSMILGVTAGADYRFNQRTVAGVALNYANTHGDLKNGGDFNTNSFGATLFTSYTPTDRTFIQLTAGYTHDNYLVSRNAQAFIPGLAGTPDRNLNGVASSSSNGNIIRVTGLTGYDHPIGMFTLGPRLGFNYTNTHIGDHAETSGGGLGLKYDDQWINSVQSVVGIQGQAAVSTSAGVLVPQVNADYIHEFANSQRFITANFVEDLRLDATRFTFQNDAPVRNYFNVGTGLIMVMRNGWQPFINFRAMVGNEQFENYAGTVGLRMEL
ncbi:hypothetical protein W02_03790 [Nitrospira sp. KM1]|uniref:autotransporter outer membrane beta-barrel domain-containing protein n=1 Tax=Nitrospira sp. KM1 TaxID=1936990 RepID=UPI0013A78DAB|nr:autotransporter outer membrane beta-barrel domain-containing protein [Nitrospira sp. KM1]BCA53239.1 hypothetical protein W02_03790 [Nitrospira sp. KM1]